MTLGDLTTLRVGGEAHRFVVADNEQSLIAESLDAWASGEEWFLLGGGSNVVIADSGFDGTVIHVRSRGIERLEAPAGRVRVRVQAGESWDGLVAHAVANGWAGLEALSGIPGTTGASPIQNIGAYGYELSDTLVAIDFLDYLSGDVVRLSADDLGLGYRTSIIKRGRQGVVLAVEMELTDAPDGRSVQPYHAQLAAALGEGVDRPPLADVREAVLSVRGSKGMVLDPRDPDSVSAGSFFTNPIVSESFARRLPEAAPRWTVDEDSVKLSAAWLIERAGIRRGFALPGSNAGISSKHTLAIINRGGATAADIASLARYVQERVRNEFGVALHPEPTYIGDV